MKYYLFLIILIPQIAYSQKVFNGKITYEYEFLDPSTREDITKEMAKSYGEKQYYFISNNSYKSYDENNNFRQLYNGSTNKYYFVNPSNNEIMVLDASYSISEVISITHSEETKMILGKLCKQVVIKTDQDKTTYFYNEDLRVDQSMFSGHLFGNWNTFLKASNGALPLEYISESENYIWISTATAYEETDFTSEDFDPMILFK